MVETVILLSVGRHPASGRARRAPLDARALELALRLPGAGVHAVHAGDPAEPALRDYLGMGLERLTVLALPAGSDPVPALAAHVAGLAPDIVLAGRCAEGGEDSGMVPYLIAQRLGCALVPDVADLDLTGDGLAGLIQALPRGRRRIAEIRPPVVATIHPAAPEPRQSAFARSRRGVIETIVMEGAPDPLATECEIRPWRPRPKRLRLPAGGSALERLKAATETKAGAGQVMIGPDPETAARAIYDYLLERRVMDAADDAQG